MKKIISIIKWFILILRWLLFLPLSFFITFCTYNFFIEKYAELKPKLFMYQPITSLIPGLEPPYQPDLLQYQILTAIIIGFLWILIGTIIAPKKKFVVSCVLFVLFALSVVWSLIFDINQLELYYLFAFIVSILAVFIIHPKKTIKLMKSKFGEYIRLGLILITISFFGLFFYNKQNWKIKWTINKQMFTEAKFSKDRVAVDMNGDGLNEMLVNPSMADDYKEATDSTEPFLALYNDKEDIIARTPEWFGSAPNAVHMDSVRPPIGTLLLKDLVQIDVTAGPHQTETMFLRLKDNVLLPVCKVEVPNNIDDCLFYNSSGSLGVTGGMLGGLGKDRSFAIIEFIDEYPTTKRISNQEIYTINKTFKDKSKEARIIAEREKGGKGMTVVWNIYVFNGKYFEVQTGDNYDKFFELLKEEFISEYESEEMTFPGVIKKSEMSKESIEYNEFAKEFWSGR